ncbi:MAG: CPBP family intramembrane metalloprotease [Lachnospiraceae bacterium]|nr:CPBP family intramembrane metalloprotease [Lachnospiraceae bacterium]
MNRVRNTNLFFLGLVLFYVLACFFIVPNLPRVLLEGNWSIVLGQMIIAIPVMIYLIIQKGKPLSYVSFKILRITDYCLLFLLTMCIIPVITLINAISMMFVENYLATELDNMNSNPLILNIVLVALIPAFVEEITFRGIIFGGYKESKTKYAIIGSALLFGLFHMNVNQFCYAFVMALLFGFIYEATGSILSTIFVHFVFNSNSVVLQKIMFLFEKLIYKMAETSEEYKELAEQLEESANETVTYADMLLTEKIGMIMSLGIPAIVGGVLAVLLLGFIAKRNNRLVHTKKLLYSFVGKEYIPNVVTEKEYTEDINESKQSKVFDVIFIISVIICIAFMIFLEIG